MSEHGPEESEHGPADDLGAVDPAPLPDGGTAAADSAFVKHAQKVASETNWAEPVNAAAWQGTDGLSKGTAPNRVSNAGWQGKKDKT